MNVTPHVAQKANGLGHRRPNNTACRLRRQPAHPQADRGSLRLDQDGRRPVEKTKLRGVERVGAPVHLRAAAYNLVRLPKLLAA